MARSGKPGDDGLTGEIADAILAVAPAWDEIRQFVRMLGRQLDAGRLFDDLIWDRRVRHYLLDVVSLGVQRYGSAAFTGAAHAALRELSPNHHDLAAIEGLTARLVEQAEAELHLVEAEADWVALRVTLRPVAKIGAGELTEIVNSASGVLPVAAEGAATLDDVLAVLDVAATPAGGIPALVCFLAALAAREPGVRDGVWVWLDERAPRWGVASDALAALREPPPDAARPQRVRAALAVMDEAPHSKRRYQLSRWLRWDNGRVSDKYDESVPRSIEELQAGGETMLGTFHEIFPAADAVEVEFYLPISAINLNVDMWRVGPGEYRPVVGNRFPAVIHSTDRLHDCLFHAAWKQRWGTLRQPHGGETARWLRWADDAESSGDLIPKLRDYDVLTALLAECVALCCLGLHESGDLLGLQVMVAAQSGVPAVLWRRDGGDVAQLRSLVSHLATTRQLAELPAKVTELRRTAAGQPDDHLGRHISLIWDSYDEREALIAGLRSPQEAPATEVQGTEHARR